LAMLCNGTSESGKPRVPNTKLPKKVRRRRSPFAEAG
jgi:hypothetical protein